jgi:hypothetical protein
MLKMPPIATITKISQTISPPAHNLPAASRVPIKNQTNTSTYIAYLSTLDELIMKLNEDDHSEDEGIEDYIIEGYGSGLSRYHPCHIGEVLINRYVLIQKLGWGHFSTVWLAKDFKYSSYVAIKIMKSAKHYLEASFDEVQVSCMIGLNTSESCKKCIESIMDKIFEGLRKG